MEKQERLMNREGAMREPNADSDYRREAEFLSRNGGEWRGGGIRNKGEAEVLYPGISDRPREEHPRAYNERAFPVPLQYHHFRSSSEQWSSAGKIKMDLTGGTFRNDRPNKIARTGPISLIISVESGTGTT